MKYPNQLTIRGNAVILHLLFPLEIPKLLTYIENVCITVTEGAQQNREGWNNPIISYDQWLNSIQEVQERITEYRSALCKSAYFFSTILFDRKTEYVSTYCLNLYVETRIHPDPEFSQTVQLLYRKLITQAIEPTEYILHAENYPDQWICICGNEAESEGFQSCYPNGDLMEPIDGLWDEHYICMKCGRIIDQKDSQVVGFNPHPKPLED